MANPITLVDSLRHQARGLVFEILVFQDQVTGGHEVFVRKQGREDFLPAHLGRPSDPARFLPLPELLAATLAEIDQNAFDLY